MALISADYKFLVVDIGVQGRHSDGGIFKNSEVGHRFNRKANGFASSIYY